MATLSEKVFDRIPREAGDRASGYSKPMINTVMTRGDWAILLVLALIWGAAFFFIHVAVAHVAPLTYVWLRLSIAAVGLLAWMRWKGEKLSLPLPVWGAILLLALLNNVVPFALFGWAQQHIASGLASILNATTPIWGVVVAHIATSDEKITPAKLIGVVVGFVGVATMIGPDLLTSGESIVPQLACIAASLCYALAGVWARRFRPMGLKPLKVATAQLLVGALVMTPVSLTVAEPWIGGSPSLAALGAITVLALACTALGYVLYFRLIDSAGATNATLVTLLVPPIAILLGALFLGELLNGTQFLGFAFTALGLAVIDGRLIAAVRRKAFA
ncbi:MAG TPA: DMT family transporter [Sphingomicrobium sp.]|nr:DMT family transporter [Sphingomicrobium sp.]